VILPKIFVAVDTAELDRARELVDAIRGTEAGVKLGMEFFNKFGPAGVRELNLDGTPVFIDLKYHDIPNTVAGAVRSISSLSPDVINVHAAGGEAMMRAAKKALDESTRDSDRRPALIAVTVLTSLDDSDLSDVGQQAPVLDQVVRLARLTQKSGLDGVVCSPNDVAAIRKACGEEFLTIVPGVRPSSVAQGDQKRVMTPEAAISQGASSLVIGRAITGADEPQKIIAGLLADIADVKRIEV
jgi:orotidine-5'-phosphate decarboxylase